MAGFIKELKSYDNGIQASRVGEEIESGRANGTMIKGKDLQSQIDYAKQYMHKELFENQGLPVQVKQDGRRYVLVHSPDWKDKFGTFHFRFRVVDEDHLYIDQLFVPDALRERGLGKACCRALTYLSKKLGKRRIYLWSVREAELFWEKVGFQIAHEATWNHIMSEIHPK